MENLNPEFVKGIQVEYNFESKTMFKVQCFNVEDTTPNLPLSRHQLIGEYSFEGHELIA